MPAPDTLERFVAMVESNAHAEAVEAFYTANASMCENQGEPRVGRDVLAANERRVLAKAQRIASECVRPLFVDGDHVVIRWRFRFEWLDGSVTRIEELAYQRWEGERIAEETFFYDPAQLERRERAAGPGMTPIRIDRLDHLVLTVRDVDATCAFYERVLGMTPVTFSGRRRGLSFGRQKINLHRAGHEFAPKAGRATPGSGDFCLIAAVPLEAVISRLHACGVELLQGPVAKTGALGAMQSVYFRDPDDNLVEVSVYDTA